jgi:predicted small metal-binding protein
VREVICPACGALTEGETDDELVQATREHTLDAHAYDIPREHVLAAAVDVLS